MVTPSAQDHRRCSARIKKIEEDKAQKRRAPSPTSIPKEKTHKKRKVTASEELPASVDPPQKPQELAVVSVDKPQELAVVAVPASAEGGNVHSMVTETIRTFNKYYLSFIQAEENRYARVAADRETKLSDSSSKSKKSKAQEENLKRPSKRPDLKAITKMMELNAVLNPEKRIGHIPGVDVGHQFFSRAEMVVVGFHQHWLNGIDYIGSNKGRNLGLKGLRLPLTVSIVLSGQYEDDFDNYDEIVYTGQGGHDLLGNKCQIADQVMERGNLGLKNCKEQSVPVRVIRGHKCRNSYVGKVYTYDGLYQVSDYWADKGLRGFTVYKFRLKRLAGQPPLTTDQVHFVRGQVPKSVSEIRGLVLEDISGGLEEIPIPVTNLVDDPPISPSGFTYIKDLKFSKNVCAPTIASSGCNCREVCGDSRSCACARLNGGDFPYVHHHGGRLVEPKAVVFECGPNCKCGPSCINRTSQRGPKYKLEVFRTCYKGWGVRSWDFIPSGAPVCEYVGLVKKTTELDPSADNTYVFDIDCLQTMKGLDGRESRLRDVRLPSYLQKEIGDEVSENVPFCIDACQTGNVARFINHSCQPNLFVQCVLSHHHDLKLARVILVAADNIPPLKELTYDYGYALDSVVGPDGKTMQMNCYCGAPECRKRLY